MPKAKRLSIRSMSVVLISTCGRIVTAKILTLQGRGEHETLTIDPIRFCIARDFLGDTFTDSGRVSYS